MVELCRFIRILERGSTSPALMETSDGSPFVLKVGSPQMPDHLAELVAQALAPAFGVAVPRGLVATVTEEALDAMDATDATTARQARMCRRAGRTAFASCWIPHAREVDGLEVLSTYSEDLGRILWFDLFIGNPDRVDANANLLIVGDRLLAIDHAQGFPWLYRREPPANLVETHVASQAGVALSRPAQLPGETILRDACDQVPRHWWPQDFDRHELFAVLRSRLAALEAG